MHVCVRSILNCGNGSRTMSVMKLLHQPELYMEVLFSVWCQFSYPTLFMFFKMLFTNIVIYTTVDELFDILYLMLIPFLLLYQDK